MVASMLFVLAFVACELAAPGLLAARFIAVALACVTAIRLYHWYAPGVLEKPLLWGLFAAFAAIVAGFLLFGLEWEVDLHQNPIPLIN